jgi:hypothetical protein
MPFTFKEKNTVAEVISDKAGNRYVKMADGSIRRGFQKPQNGKSQRRKTIRLRRDQRNGDAEYGN